MERGCSLTLGPRVRSTWWAHNVIEREMWLRPCRFLESQTTTWSLAFLAESEAQPSWSQHLLSVADFPRRPPYGPLLLCSVTAPPTESGVCVPSLVWVCLMACLDGQNPEEVMPGHFWGYVLRGLDPPAFTLLGSSLRPPGCGDIWRTTWGVRASCPMCKRRWAPQNHPGTPWTERNGIFLSVQVSELWGGLLQNSELLDKGLWDSVPISKPIWASQVALVGKNSPATWGVRDAGSVPRAGRSPGGGHGNPLQCSCLEQPMDRGAWWATVRRVAQSRTRLKRQHGTSPFRKWAFFFFFLRKYTLKPIVLLTDMY